MKPQPAKRAAFAADEIVNAQASAAKASPLAGCGFMPP